MTGVQTCALPIWSTFSDISEDAIYSGTQTSTLTVTSPPETYNAYRYRLKATTFCSQYLANSAKLTINTDVGWKITKAVAETFYKSAGDKLNYSILLENLGTVSISSVLLSDPGADAGSVVRGADNPGNNDNILEAGEKWTYTAVRTATASDVSAGSFTNTVTANGTPASGTLNPESSSVTVCAKPVISGTLTVCTGSTTQLSGTGTAAASNAWSSANTGVATVDASGKVTGVAAGTTQITFTTLQGCSESVSVTVNQSPTITGFSSVCRGSTIQLEGSGTPSSVSPWISSLPAVASVTSTGLVTGLSAGTTVLTYTESNGCKATLTLTVVASPLISGPDRVCVGESITLTGSGNPDRKSTRLNSSHIPLSRMPSSA